MSESQGPPRSPSLYSEHSRHWRSNLYVYPVISRRSGGLSIGVNLNPDKACNFDCIYCQVDRDVPPQVRRVDPDLLAAELEGLVRLAVGGELFEQPHFGHVPPELRRINDIAFSGDGEPTASPQFPVAVEIAVALRRRYQLDAVKLVLITDAAFLHRPKVRDALAVMDENNGEIWAKLDAGTEAYFRTVNRAKVAFDVVLDNITAAARERPIVIQSLWMRIEGQGPPDAEIDAFARRLAGMIDAGGAIKLVQLYTVARRPAESFVSALGDDELARLAARVRAVVDVPVRVYGSQ